MALKMFGDDNKEFAVLRVKLTQWATKHSSLLSSEEFGAMLKDFVAAASVSQALTEVAFDSQRAANLVNKVVKPLSDSLRVEMVKAMPVLMEQVLAQAGGVECFRLSLQQGRN